jgi:uncharacterized LabA/DUF88 family protein
VALFIDGSNLFYAALHLGIEIDYTKRLSCLTGNTQLLRAFFYTGTEGTNEKQQGFLLWMRRNSYPVVTRDGSPGARLINFINTIHGNTVIAIKAS